MIWFAGGSIRLRLILYTACMMIRMHFDSNVLVRQHLNLYNNNWLLRRSNDVRADSRQTPKRQLCVLRCSSIQRQ